MPRHPIEELDLTQLALGELDAMSLAFQLLEEKYEHGGPFLAISKIVIRLVDEERQRRIAVRWSWDRKPSLFS